MYDDLYAYQTIIQTLTNTTLVELLYGTKIMVPLQIQRPTIKFASLIDLPLNKYKRKRLAQVIHLGKKRSQATKQAKKEYLGAI